MIHHELQEKAEMAQAQTRVFKMWFRNFLSGKGQVTAVPVWNSFRQPDTDASEHSKAKPKPWHDNLYWLRRTA